MEIIEAAKQNIAYLLLTLIGGAGVVSLLIAAGMYLMSHGDQQQTAKARTALWSGVIGLILGGFAYAIPTVLSETVLQPSGGQGFGVQEAGTCDDVFRRELILQPNVNITSRMVQLVRVIQQQEEDCLSDTWNPVPTAGAVPATAATWAAGSVQTICFGGTAPAATEATAGPFEVDGILVPSTLIRGEPSAASGNPVAWGPTRESRRDVKDNILVYFTAAGTPTDLSRCWMYLSRDQLWLSAN